MQRSVQVRGQGRTMILTGGTLLPREQLTMFGGISLSELEVEGLPLLSSKWRPGTLLSILQGKGQPPTTKNDAASNVNNAKNET